MVKGKKEIKKESYFKGVKEEAKKIVWPSRKELVKYSISTIVFILFMVLFFLLVSALISLVNLI